MDEKYKNSPTNVWFIITEEKQIVFDMSLALSAINQ